MQVQQYQVTPSGRRLAIPLQRRAYVPQKKLVPSPWSPYANPYHYFQPVKGINKRRSLARFKRDQVWIKKMDLYNAKRDAVIQWNTDHGY